MFGSRGSRSRRALRAYWTLRRIAGDHRALGHEVEFTALNEARISLWCHTCQPGPPAPEGPIPGIPDRLHQLGHGEIADQLDAHDLGLQTQDRGEGLI